MDRFACILYSIFSILYSTVCCGILSRNNKQCILCMLFAFEKLRSIHVECAISLVLLRSMHIHIYILCRYIYICIYFVFQHECRNFNLSSLTYYKSKSLTTRTYKSKIFQEIFFFLLKISTFQIYYKI